MQTALPPLPRSGAVGNPGMPDEQPSAMGQAGGMGMSPSAPQQVSSAFSGGLPGMMQSIQKSEAGLQELAQQLPPLAPLIAEFISKLRMAVPNAIGAGAGMQGPPGAQMGQIPGGQSGLPSPPM